MIGSLIGAGLGLAGSIFGGIKARKAAKKQAAAIEDARRKNDAWYNKEYYQDYSQRSDSQAAMRNVRDFMKRSNQNVAATAAVTGATPEAIAAQKESANKVVSDTAANIQANADAYKTSIQGQYNAKDAQLNSAKIDQYKADEAGAAQTADMGQAIMGAAVSGIGGTSSPKVTPGMVADFGKQSAADSIARLNQQLGSVWNK